MRTHLAALGTGLALLGQASSSHAGGDGLLYGINSDDNKIIYELDVSGAAPTFRAVGKNDFFAASNTLARDPTDGALWFTGATAPSGLARFDPTLHNPPTTDCVATPAACNTLIGTPALNGTLAGRMGMRQFTTAPDPRLFAVDQTATGRPIKLVDRTTGVATTYGTLTVNTGPGGDHDFVPRDILCPGASNPTINGGADFTIPAGSLFIVSNDVTARVWFINASEFTACDNTAECSLATSQVSTISHPTDPAARPQGLGFDMNDNAGLNSGRARAWVSWSDGLVNAIDPCSGLILAGSGANAPIKLSDLSSVVDPGVTGFTGFVCRCVETTGTVPSLALLLVPGLLSLRRRRRRQA